MADAIMLNGGQAIDGLITFTPTTNATSVIFAGVYSTTYIISVFDVNPEIGTAGSVQRLASAQRIYQESSGWCYSLTIKSDGSINYFSSGGGRVVVSDNGDGTLTLSLGVSAYFVAGRTYGLIYKNY